MKSDSDPKKDTGDKENFLNFGCKICRTGWNSGQTGRFPNAELVYYSNTVIRVKFFHPLGIVY